MNNWQNVFDAYPLVNEIYVVDGMPFLKAEHAQGHSRATGKPVQTVLRGQSATAEEATGLAEETKPKKGKKK